MTDYDNFVEIVAQNTLDLGESPRTAAEMVVVDTENVGLEKTIQYSAEPYVDDPVRDTRLWPKEVLEGSDRGLVAGQPDDLRYLAVEVLKADLYVVMMEIENSTMPNVEESRRAANAEIAAERRLDERRERHFDRYGHFGPGHDPGPD